MYTGSPAKFGAIIVPSDTVNQSDPFQALNVGSPGNINVQQYNGAVMYYNVAAGVFPVSGIRVNLTGTTAAQMTAMWS